MDYMYPNKSISSFKSQMRKLHNYHNYVKGNETQGLTKQKRNKNCYENIILETLENMNFYKHESFQLKYTSVASTEVAIILLLTYSKGNIFYSY